MPSYFFWKSADFQNQDGSVDTTLFYIFTVENERKPIIFSRVLLVSHELWAFGVAHKLVVIIHEDLSIS